jgi:predicted  nucleic acid-binding Zn-ribbon protein
MATPLGREIDRLRHEHEAQLNEEVRLHDRIKNLEEELDIHKVANREMVATLGKTIEENDRLKQGLSEIEQETRGIRSTMARSCHAIAEHALSMPEDED